MLLQRVAGVMGLLVLITVGTVSAQARPATRPAAPTKVGYINFRAAVSQVPGFPEAEAAFAREQQEAQRLLKAIEDSAEAAQNDYTARAATVPPAQAEAQRKALEAKGTAWAARADTLQLRLQNRERELLAPMQQAAGAAVEVVRKEGGYALVLDASSPSNSIIAADTTADLTARVVAKLKSAKKP